MVLGPGGRGGARHYVCCLELLGARMKSKYYKQVAENQLYNYEIRTCLSMLFLQYNRDNDPRLLHVA